VFDYLIKPVHYQRLQHTLERFARYRSSLRSSEQASQIHVDALFNIQAKSSGSRSAPLRGLMKAPFIGQLFADPETVHTATLARILGSSKTTARRYLEQGVKNDFLEAEISYGKVGRPERIYHGKHPAPAPETVESPFTRLFHRVADNNLPFFIFTWEMTTLPSSDRLATCVPPQG
jgi:two-component system response regulator CitB